MYQFNIFMMKLVFMVTACLLLCMGRVRANEITALDGLVSDEVQKRSFHSVRK